jgi:hypothetical protein
MVSYVKDSYESKIKECLQEHGQLHYTTTDMDKLEDEIKGLSYSIQNYDKWSVLTPIQKSWLLELVEIKKEKLDVLKKKEESITNGFL